MSIYQKLHKAQASVSGIEKTGRNSHFNYDFFEEREVLRVAREALSDAGLVFFYSVDDVSDRAVTTSKGREELLTDVRMTCTIFDAEGGESVTGKAIGRGQDGQDKGVNKAIVAGLKYWLLKTLMIPTGDDTERDENTSPEGNVPRHHARTSGGNGPVDESENTVQCPKCGGDMWDNRIDKKNPRAPDFKCKDKKCDEALWMGSWPDNLIKAAQEAFDAGVIDEGEKTGIENRAVDGNPVKMSRAARWLNEKAAAVAS